MARPAFPAPARRLASILIAVALAIALAVTSTACMAPVAAEAATVAGESVGYAAESSFVRGALTYGERTLARETLAKGGEYAGSKAGLYGGSLKTSTCNVNKLVKFLKNPAHRKKAAAWAQVLGLAPDNIENYLLHKVTPVLLGNDTLVGNHGFDKGRGRATAYDSVLEAGMAVLVDVHGVPAVKCNCGNPLTSPKTDIDVKIKITYKGRKWHFKQDRMVKVNKSTKRHKSLVLANPSDPGQNIVRQVGADGWQADHTVPATVTVPDDLVGQSADAASEELRQLGLRPVTEPSDTESDQPQGTVTSTDPDANSTAEPGSTVTLTVAADATPSAGEESGGTEGTTTPPDTSPSTTDDGGTSSTGDDGGAPSEPENTSDAGLFGGAG